MPISLYRIRRELEHEGIVVTPDYLFHTAKRHCRLRIVKETYEREVYGVDDDDAERLKALVRAAWRKRAGGPRPEKGGQKQEDTAPKKVKP